MNNISSTEAYFVTKPENLVYLTGFDGEGFVVLTKKKGYVCTDQRYWILAKNVKPKDFELLDRADKKMKEYLKKELRAVKLMKMEEETLSVAGLKRWKKFFGGKKWSNGEGYVEKLRLEKSSKEISALRMAGKIGDAVMAKTLNAVRPGKTELEIKTVMQKTIADSAAEGESFDPIIAFGENSAVPHHVSTDKKLGKDDVILIDMGVKYKGYCSDMTRTFFIGKPRPELKGMFQLTKEAQKEASGAVRAGVRIRYLDEIARSVMGEEAQFFTHSLGHGVGLEIHEAPVVSGGNEQKLTDGMVITIEPGIYKEGIGGIRIEDMMVVTKSGSTNLTRFPKHPDLMRYK
jgi:Xaa-Pro aminopeptidase